MGRDGATWLLAALALLLCPRPVSSRFLRFEPGYEYQYKFKSDAQVHSVDKFTMEARVGYTCLGEVPEGQEIRLNVIALTLSAGTAPGQQGHGWDFSKWFSFVLTPRGEVVHVQHVASEDAETLAVKKGLAALLAARLHDHRDQDEVTIIKTDEGWRYHVQELGHEGPHNATYDVKPSEMGKVFTKTRHNHPVPHAKGSYSKTIHYHDDMKIIHTVEIAEDFDTMSEPPQGYDPYIAGHERPAQDDEHGQPVLPSMTGEGRGKLEFLTRLRVTDQSKLRRPDTWLVKGSIHIDKVARKEPRVNLTTAIDSITGNLTCMREQPQKGSQKLTDCFFSMLEVLRLLSDDDITILTDDYFGPQSSVRHFERDRAAILDALWNVHTDHAYNTLAQHVLLVQAPGKEFVERLLYHIGGADILPPEPVVRILISLALEPEKHAEIFQKRQLHHHVLLTMGSLIRLMADQGDTERAGELGAKLQDMLGVHDPWAFRKRRSTLTEGETIEEDLYKVVLLEALGNARLDQSYEHIVSHVNNSNSQWVKRAGVHALRDYHHDHAANVILMAALNDEHWTVRYDAALQYRRHPKAGVALTPNDIIASARNSSTYIDPSTMDLTSLALHDRRKRQAASDLFTPVELMIQSPSVDWQKQLGSDKIGASFGLTIKNELDIKIELLSGHGKIDIYDEAFGQVNLGFMGINLDVLRARLCFRGHAEYNLNLFQEFDVKEIERLTQMFDQLKEQTVDAVVNGIKAFKALLDGDIPFADIIKAFADAIKQLPDKIVAVGKKAIEALVTIGQYDDKELPPFIIPLKNLVMKVSNLINDIRSDVMGFYNKLMTATVVIPYGGKQIFKSVKEIINSFQDFHKDPKSAISTVTGNTLTVGIQVKAMVDAVKDAKEAAFFLKKEKPYWWDMRAQARELLNMSREVKKAIEKQGPAWIKGQVEEIKDEIQQFTNGKLSVAELKKQVINDLLALPAIAESILPLENLGDDIGKAFTDLFNLVEQAKKAYDALREGTRKAKQFIERVFGPKAHKHFPRQTRTPGGSCNGKGFYPATLQSTDPEYRYEGVDLLLGERSNVVAPFPGIIYLSDKDNEVVIESRGGSPRGVDFIITNVKANSTVRSRTDRLYTELEVAAGQVIGEATKSPCKGFNHIHFAIRKDDNTVDPTRFVEPRLPEMPAWIQECDDYKFVYKGRTLGAGSIVGLLGRKNNDTTPKRTAETEKPAAMPAAKDPSTKLDSDVKQPTSVAKRVQDNKAQAKDTALKSKDSALKTLFESATTFMKNFNVKDMKMGSLVKLLSALKLDDSMGKLTNVFQTIQAMLDNKPCLNPNQMSDDDLATALRNQGKSTVGSREELITRYTARSDKCMTLSLGLPKQMYCIMDQQCLGLECCLDIKVSFFRKVYKLYARFDPCSFNFIVGISDHYEKSFGPDYGLDDIFGGFEETVPTGITISQLSAELFIHVALIKEETSVMVSVAAKFCKQDDSSDCLAVLDVLDRALLPIPSCGPDGKLYFPSMAGLKESLKSQKDKFITSGKELGKQALRTLADEVFDLIPCVESDDAADEPPCERPDKMTEETLTQTLEHRGLDTGGTTAEKVARLELADRTCTIPVIGKKVTLPALQSKLSKFVHLKLDEKCLGINACVDIPIPQIDYHRSVRAAVSLDACMPTFRANFESCSYEILLFNTSMNAKYDFPLSDFFRLKTNIRKLDADTAYTVDLGMRIQMDGTSEPILDDMFVLGFQVPIPICSDFTLPGNGSLRELASAAGDTLSTGAVRYFMKTLKLDTIFIEGTCEEVNLQKPVCPWELNFKRFIPASFKDHLTCVMTPNCLGIKCCIDLAIKLPLMKQPIDYYVPFHLMFLPCENMKIDMLFGTYTRVEQLLSYEFGASKRLSVGKGQHEGEDSPIVITYAVDHYRTMDPYDEGFLLDLNLEICIPFDGERICFPDDSGIDVLKAEKVPVCNPAAIAELRKTNLTAFMEQVGQLDAKSLTRSAAQILLNKFGITQNLKENRCDPKRAPYETAVDGWNNECALPTQKLPTLPSSAVCHFSPACNRLDCCLYSEFLDMTFNVWFELNCDLYIQAGLERLTSPKLYVLGGEVDWNAGIAGEVNISEAFRLEYLIRKDDMNFIVDVRAKLCFDRLGGTCQFSLDVMKATKIPQLGCHPGAVSYFTDLQFFERQTCKLPPAATGCQLSLPASLNGKCVLTDECRGIHCCVPVNLGLLGTYAMDASFKFDPCTDAFVYSLEQKSGSLSLASVVDVPQKEDIGKVISFTYRVHKTINGYTLQAEVRLCALDPDSGDTTTCFNYDILPDVVTIYAPSSDCTRRKRRRRRQVEKVPCSQSTLPHNELILQMIENEASQEEIEQCMADFERAEEWKCDQLDAAQGSDVNMFTPKAIAANLGSANPGTLIMCNKKLLVTVNIEGADIIQGMLKKVEDIKGRLEQTFIPGKGLTGAGAKALGFKMAGMTIGELQAYVMSEGVDPELAIQLMKDLKDLLYTLYSDIISSITNGGAEDLFKSFDLAMTGDFSIPRVESTFFKYSQFFLVGGLIPMTFKFEAGISYGTQIMVSAKMMTMSAVGEVQPYVGLIVRGELGIGAILYGKLSLTGYICQIAFPSRAEITFSAFPMGLDLAMDMDLKPLELKLTALVTLEVNLLFTTIKKTLFKTNLWQYVTPTIRKRILTIGKAEQDTSPPNFASFEDDNVGRKRRAQATNKCTVRQLDGRDYTEPAIEIGVAASDDKSKPTLVAYIGTKPGLQDLLVTELGGPSTIVNTHLGVSGQPVYFKVVAINNQGTSAEVTCVVDTYDVTPPTGRLEAEFGTTSNKRALHGALVVYEDSEITVANLAVGVGKGVYGAGVRLWEPVNLKSRTVQAYNAGSDTHGEVALNNHFTDFKEGRLIVPALILTLKMTAQFTGECAKKCLSYSENKCMSFNFNSMIGDCEILGAIESHDHKLAVASNYLHFERLGTGLAHAFKFEVLDLVHNKMYFLNMYMENALGYTNYIASTGTLVDLTPPEPGPMVIASDTMEIVSCEANLPSDRRDVWKKWCRGIDPTQHNHRTVIDAPGSATIFNGYTRLEDLKYTKANTFISANWDGIHDYESGILGYSLAIGRSVCEEWQVHYDPHKHLVPIDDDSQWTHIGVVNMEKGYNLPDGKYYVTLRALNEVEYGGPLATTFCHSNPLGIDTTPPIVYEVFGTRYDEDSFNITTQYNASDPHSDIATAHICLGRTVLTCDEMQWRLADQLGDDFTRGPVSVSEQIRDGVPVWVRLRVQNYVELQAIGHANSPIIVDKSPPLAGKVYDGSIYKHDLSFSKDQFQYCANWFNFSDPQSGIDFYMGAVLSETREMLTNLTTLDRREHFTCLRFDNLPLKHNVKYRFLLYAFNGGHKQLNVSAESDGVLVDLTAPVAGEVVDGLRPEFKDVSFTVHKATVSAQWRNFTDPESGITQYEVKVQRAANLTSDFQVIKDWSNQELAQSFEGHNFHLKHRDVVKTQVKATNGALNTITTETNAFIVDMTPPVRVSLWDGSDTDDVEYQSDTSRLYASFVFEDEESGIDHYKYQVYQTMHGQRTQIHPASRNTWVDLAPGPRTGIEVTGLTLTPSLRYSLRVAAINNAGSVATYDTNGVIIDDSPPTVESVSVGVLSSEDEIAIDGYVLQSDQSGIKASWLAMDHESGIDRYEVAVGTSPGATDILPWRNMGQERDGYINGLALQLTDAVSGSPVYYVSVRAANGAGDLSSALTSTPIKILQEDQAGIVTDGGVDTIVMSTVGLHDVDVQSDQWTVTAQFRGFTSHQHGLTRFDWSVGTSPEAEDVMPLTAEGIMHDESEADIPGNGVSSRGVAQAVLPLKPGMKYYTTVRALNNDGQAVQSTSDGFTLDISPPQLGLISVALESGSSRLVPETVLYQREPDALSAQWNYTDIDSKVVRLSYAIGTYPGDSSIVTLTPTVVSDSQEGTMPSEKINLHIDGSPNILSLWAEDSVGFVGSVVAPAVVVDVTGPEEGLVTCPSYIQAHSQVLCKWDGFRDLQSPMRAFIFSMGTAAGKTDVLAPVTLSAGVNSYVITDLAGVLTHDTEVYATVIATNAVGLNTTATSAAISMDTTPPVAGTVVELSDAYIILVGNATGTQLANTYTCDSLEACEAIDMTCQESLTSVLVAWSAFEDPETGISKYEVAVGNSPGGGQIKAFHEVPAGQRYHLVQGLDLMGEREIFVTVKASNGAGATTSATSNGVYLSYLSQGLVPPGPVEVWDQDSDKGDIDYQTSLVAISARWHVDGDPCPAVKFEWAIQRVDGLQVQDFYNTQGKTFGLNDGLALLDLQTYYQLVRVTNALDYTYTLRSDGVTIHQNSLIPGQVFDGSKTGFDLNFQPSQTKVSANWQGFGDSGDVSQVTPAGSVQTSAVDREKDPFQEVAYYEVALGSDRRYDTTRDDVVPWTNVGLDTNVTFVDLSLAPGEAVYYFSVRGHSTSNSVAAVTSNGFSVGFDGGVSGGVIDMEDYVSNDTKIQVSWSGFESDIGMFFYYVAVSSAQVDNSSCQDFTEGGSMRDELRRMQFDIADRLNMGDQTFAALSHLNMTQNTDNYLHIIGVDRAGQCRMISKKFHVDITRPVAGKVRTGPYYDMALTFARSASDVTAEWEGFADPDSPLTFFRLELLMQPKCDASVPPGGDIITSVEIEAKYSQYTFLEQQLVAGFPYFVRVTAVNKAGLSISVTSPPILYDDSSPVPGLVVDGTDFRTDLAWTGSSTSVTATVLHLPTPEGAACPSRPVLFSDTKWQFLTSSQRRDLSGRVLAITSQSAKAKVGDAGQSVTLTMTRDTNKHKMYSAAMFYEADLVQGGTYEVDIKAATGFGQAVTSVMLWDGPTTELIHYDYTRVVEPESFCVCCFDNQRPLDCESVCNCTKYVKDVQSLNDSSTLSGRRKRSVQIMQLTSEEKEALKTGSVNDLPPITLRRPACGLQLYTLNANDTDYVAGFRGRMVAWCTFGVGVMYDPGSVTTKLTFDPSADFHRYKLKVYEVADEQSKPTKCLGVFVDVDTVFRSTVCGIPSLRTDTKLAITVWNWKNFLTDTNSGGTNITVWQTSATFKNLIVPAPKESLCRYGAPFRGGQNTIVRYEAGLSSQDGMVDVTPFREVYTPCVPCVDQCDKYNCDLNCSATLTTPLALTLDGLDLLPGNFSATGEYKPSVYYFTVKAVLGSGMSVVVKSGGFSVDTTPPAFDPSVFFYLDAAQGEAKPIQKLMASNSTIRVLYSCSDNESSIVEYEWAIGTTPGGLEVQNWTSTGVNPTGVNSELQGIITHLAHYYVSVRCTNGGGISTTFTDTTGVIAYIEALSVTDVTGELPGAEVIDPAAIPATARKSSDANSMSVKLQISKDPTIDTYYFSIGSTKTPTTDSKCDDIFPRTLVASTISGTISIRDGYVYMDGFQLFSLRQGRQGYNGSDNTVPSSADFQMEPGRELFAFVDSCNEAQCSSCQMIGSVVVVSSQSFQAVSQTGSALRMNLASGRTKRSASQIFIQTPDGLLPGQSVVLTKVTHAELTTTYESVASTSFVSYISNPEDTLYSVETVDRILAGRATYSSTETVAFSLTSVGQVEMPGAVTVTYPYNPSDVGSTITLLHWNPAVQKWQQSHKSCANQADTFVKDANSGTVTVKVCDTYDDSGYFSEQTLFLVTTVNNSIPNDLPVLTSALNFTMLEDEGSALYTVGTDDADGDTISVQLAASPLSPDEGELILTTSNLLIFTPCQDCSGEYLLKLLLVEDPVSGITPHTATATITATVTPTNDAPVAFTFHSGTDLVAADPSADIVILLDQNRVNESDVASYTFVMGAYDTDSTDTLTLTVEGASYGVLTSGMENATVPDCSSFADIQDDSVPCYNMTLPHAASSLSWRYRTLTYQPNVDFYGYDTVQFVATDDGGSGSFVLTVKFAVMERPCLNEGVCQSKDSSYTCYDTRRADSFDTYYLCNCSAGYYGLHCDDNFNECNTNPCSWPLVCYDRVNSYECACPEDDPDCNGLEGWMIAVIVLACVLTVVVVLLGVYIWAIRTGRIKWSLFGNKKRPGSADSQRSFSSSNVPPTPPADYQFTNQAFEDIDYNLPTKGGAALFTKTTTPNLPPVLHTLDTNMKRPSMDHRSCSDLPSSSGSQTSMPFSVDSQYNYNVDHVYRPISPTSHSTPASLGTEHRPRSGSTGSESRIGHAWEMKKQQFLQPDYLPPMSSPLANNRRAVSEVQVSMHGNGAGHHKSSRAISIGSTSSINRPGSGSRPITPVERANDETW